MSFRSALILFSVASMVAGAACTENPPFPRRGQPVRADCPSIGEDDYFFPAESLFPADPSRDYERRLSLSSYLVAAGATSLSCTGHDAYRVTWMGGFNEPSLIVTADGHGATAIEFEPFNVALRTIKSTHSKVISPVQFQEIASGFESAGLWVVDPVQVLESEGSSWTLEGRRDNSYRVITRTHPDLALVNTGRLLVSLSGVPLPDRMSRTSK